MASGIREEPFKNADRLWEYLSAPTKPEGSDDEVIYRGHADADWDLVPTILRGESAALLQELVGRPLLCEDQAWMEFQMLRSFIEGCDEAGVTVPNDSVRFRDINLTNRSFVDYYEYPSTWPNDDLVEAMAMARLHGLPTRLLDWSTHPYVAVYFASSEALRTQSHWKPGQKLAVIELNKGPSTETRCGPIRVLRVRGSISENVVAQQGLFTVHPILGKQGDPPDTGSLEQYLPPPPDSSIRKLTLPVAECVRLYELCHRFKFNAARVYPSADGASEFVMEEYRYTLAYHSAETV